MMTAKEARQKLKKREYELVEKRIKERIANGDNYAYVPIPTQSDLESFIALLEKRGYQHKPSGMNDRYLRITWETEKKG